MLKWFGYVKVGSDVPEDLDTEYFTDDEDVKSSEAWEVTSIRKAAGVVSIEERLAMR